MRMLMRGICLGLLLAVTASVLPGDSANAGERRGYRGGDYSGYDNDAVGLLDAINRDHGTPPKTSFSGVGRGPLGHMEINPYDPDLWYRDEVGMIDAINRDHGIPPPTNFSGVGRGPLGYMEINPYDPDLWYRDEVGMIDAINREHPPVYP